MSLHFFLLAAIMSITGITSYARTDKASALSTLFLIQDIESVNKNNDRKSKNTVLITGSFSAHNKIFDNTRIAIINHNDLELVGIDGDDIVFLENIQLHFLSPGIGINKTVIITDATLGGKDADKYTLSLENAPASEADILGYNYFGGEGRGDVSIQEATLGLDGQLIYTWVGGTEGAEHDWFTNTNWCRGIVPAPFDRVVIANPDIPPIISGNNENHLLINGLTQIYNQSSLTIETGSSLTIETNASVLTTNNALIIIENEASYVNLSQSKPKLEINRLNEGNAGWRNLSSAVKTSYADLSANLVTQGFAGSDFPDLQPNLLWWHEADIGTTLQHWRKPESISDTIIGGRGHFHFVFNGAGILNPDGTPSGDHYDDELPLMINATGYEYPFSEQNTFNFGITFTPFNKHYSNGYSKSDYIETNNSDIGWNLIGNPTASYINWDNDQGWIKNHIDNVIYIWDPNFNSGEYLTWNGVVGSLENGLISPFSAFWVKANDAEAYLSINNDAKTLFNNHLPKHDIITTDCHETIIQLTLTAHNMKTTSYITLNTNPAADLENMNAYRLEPLTDTWLALYTNSSHKHTAPLVINNLPINPEYEQHVPLFVHALIEGQGKGGHFRLDWEFSDCIPGSIQVYLMDHLNKQAVSMRHHNIHDFEIEVSKTMNAMGVDPFALPLKVIGNYMSDDHKTVGSKQSEITHKQPFSIVIRKADHWNEPGYMPCQPILLPIYPNPFNDRLTIPFRLTKMTRLHIEIYDVYGHLLRIAAHGEYPPGLTEVYWYAGNIPPGIYYVRMVTDNHTSMQKAIKI